MGEYMFLNARYFVVLTHVYLYLNTFLQQDKPDELDEKQEQLDPGQELRIETLENMKELSKAQQEELKFLRSLRWVKTRTLRGREKHVAAIEPVDAVTEKLMTIDRVDVPLKYKLPDGKIKHILDFYTEVTQRHITSPYACVTSSDVNEEKFKKRFNVA